MAITNLQLPREMYAEGELVAGAAPIKYEGDMRPQAQTASYGFDDAMAESRQAYEDYKKRGIIPPTLTFDEFLELSQEGGFFEMADGGSIRQNYGLGSIVKKIGKGIKKVVDNPFVQTALMMNPATAPYAMTYSGLRSLKQGDPMGAMMAMQGASGTGWGQNQDFLKLGNSPFLKNTKEGTSTIGNLANLAKGKNALDLSTSNKNDPSNWQKALNLLLKSKNEQGEYKYNPLKVGTGALLGLGGIGLMQKAANEKQPKIEDMIGDRGSKIGLDDIQIKVQAAIDSGDKETYENLRVTENLAYLPPWEAIKKADGGRIGYAAGGQTSAEMLQVIERLRAEGKTELEIQQILKQMFQNRMSMPAQGIQSIGQSGPASFIDTVITETGASGQMPTTTDVASIRDNASIMKPVSAEMSGNMRPELMRMMGGMRRTKEDPRLNQLNRFYQDMMQPQENQRPVPEISPYQAADGGRIGYAIGDVVEEVEEEQRPRDQMEEIEGQTAGPQWWWDRVQHLEYLGYSHEEAGQIAMDSSAYYDIVGYPGEFAQGGRAGAAEGGLMSLDGNEMDLRGGGFVPIGAQEKADDVPARLSKNEFVFTADAVRAAGDGDVDRGADKMYKTMKQLESRVA